MTVRAEESWWSETVRAVGRDWSRSLPGSRIYKSRWMLESQRPRSQPRFSIGIGFSTWLGADPD